MNANNNESNVATATVDYCNFAEMNYGHHSTPVEKEPVRLYEPWSYINNYIFGYHYGVPGEIHTYDNLMVTWVMDKRRAPVADYASAIVDYSPNSWDEKCLDNLLTGEEVDALRKYLEVVGIRELYVSPVSLPVSGDSLRESSLVYYLASENFSSSNVPTIPRHLVIAPTASYKGPLGLENILGYVYMNPSTLIRTSMYPDAVKVMHMLDCIEEANERLEHIDSPARLVHMKRCLPYYVESISAEDYRRLSPEERRNGVDNRGRVRVSTSIGLHEQMIHSMSLQVVRKMNAEIEVMQGDFRVVLLLNESSYRGLCISLRDYNGLTDRERKYGVRNKRFVIHKPNIATDAFPRYSFFRTHAWDGRDQSTMIYIYRYTAPVTTGVHLGSTIVNYTLAEDAAIRRVADTLPEGTDKQAFIDERRAKHDICEFEGRGA